MVVSAREETSKIGAAILEHGGYVFDAKMATEMAFAVTYPYTGNLGGSFLVYGMADGKLEGGEDLHEDDTDVVF